MVHVGVSGIANKITIEQKGNNTGYEKKDVKGQTPKKKCCVNDGEECILSGIDMSQVCDEINEAENELQAEVSHDAGRWVYDIKVWNIFKRWKIYTAEL